MALRVGGEVEGGDGAVDPRRRVRRGRTPTSSRTCSVSRCRAGSCTTRARRGKRASAGSAVTSVPASSTRPAVGGSRPARARSRVDLPAPLGPISATTSPRATERSMPCSTARPPRATSRARAVEHDGPARRVARAPAGATVAGRRARPGRPARRGCGRRGRRCGRGGARRPPPPCRRPPGAARRPGARRQPRRRPSRSARRAGAAAGAARARRPGPRAGARRRTARRSRRPSRCGTPASASAARACGTSCSRGTPRFSRPKATSRSTSVCTPPASGSWNSRPTASGAVTRPAKRPPWKRGTRPARQRSTVDLPPPDGPASTSSSPARTSSETSASASAAASG